jgi:hypothetical protein
MRREGVDWIDVARDRDSACSEVVGRHFEQHL